MVHKVVVVDSVAEAVQGQPVQVCAFVPVLADDHRDLVEFARVDDVLGGVGTNGAVDGGSEPARE